MSGSDLTPEEPGADPAASREAGEDPGLAEDGEAGRPPGQGRSGAAGSLEGSEVQACLRVLEALVADRAQLGALSAEVRRRLLIAAGRVSRPTRDEARRLNKRLRRRDQQERRAHDLRLLEATETRGARRRPLYLPPPRVEPAPASAAAPPEELRRPRACYVCKTEYARLHHFYDQLCPPCAELNYAKRFQSAPLDGRVALVTGARVKIGYQTALMLLRAGATVVVTTRFPHDAALRYAREPDFAAWGDRLQVQGLDLRHLPSVELFAAHLSDTLPRLDVLVNNAAQTVRRPPGFYAHLMALEARPLEALPLEARPLLQGREGLRRAAAAGALPAAGGRGEDSVVRFAGELDAVGLLDPARLSQLPFAPEDASYAPEHFPLGRVDGDLQQVDLRPHNSWRLQLAEVSTPELLEVHLVNAIAPFVLNSRLKPLMTRQRSDDKHVLNVSAMEAQFARNKKTDKHPHTNMAKAALNMMTRTSAGDYARDGIFMNSVDTGWVTDEDPMHHAVRKQAVHDFHPPLDIVDGAARVLDPLFTGLNTGVHPWGKFFKDYRPVSW